MIIEIDDNSGFCFGVVNAIEKAENELQSKGYVNSLGDIVHNKMEMERLKKRGLITIKYGKLNEISGDTVFIRAHGEPPETYKKIEELNYNIVDATCPVVARLQKHVYMAYQQMKPVGGQVVILGKRGHPEVVGLTGQIGDNCIIIENVEELNHLIDFSRPIYFLSQTTQSLSLFNEIVQNIRRKITNDTPRDFYVIMDTICRKVSNRESFLKEFSLRFDLILFVSGAESSNGKALYEVCLGVNSNSKKIESISDFDKKWLIGVNSIGICGATSTPRWLMEDIAKDLALLSK